VDERSDWTPLRVRQEYRKLGEQHAKLAREHRALIRAHPPGWRFSDIEYRLEQLEREMHALRAHPQWRQSRTSRAIQNALKVHEPPGKDFIGPPKQPTRWRWDTSYPVPAVPSSVRSARLVKALTDAMEDVAAGVEREARPEKKPAPVSSLRLAKLERQASRQDDPAERALAGMRERLAAAVLKGDEAAFRRAVADELRRVVAETVLHARVARLVDGMQRVFETRREPK